MNDMASIRKIRFGSGLGRGEGFGGAAGLEGAVSEGSDGFLLGDKTQV
jgi:hypothetical protein